MACEIVLPHGTEYLSTDEISKLIANALYPKPPHHGWWGRVENTGDKRNGIPSPLTDADWELLGKILPPDLAERFAHDSYGLIVEATALANAPGAGFDGTLRFYSDPDAAVNGVGRVAEEENHKERLTKAIEAKEVEAFNRRVNGPPDWAIRSRKEGGR